MHRFFVPKDQILNETIEFDEDQIHHIKNVLKLVNGTKIEAFNGEYKSYLASVNYINKDVNADILEVKEEESSDFKLNIFQAIIKNQKLECIVEKLNVSSEIKCIVVSKGLETPGPQRVQIRL